MSKICLSLKYVLLEPMLTFLKEVGAVVVS